MVSRREFLTRTASLSALAALPTISAAAETIAPAQTNVLMDWHSHFVSQTEMRYLAARKVAPRVLTEPDGSTRLQNVDTVSSAAGAPSELSASDIEHRVRHLEQNGIEHQLLTYTVAMGFDATLPLEDLRPLYRAFNDELAGVVQKYKPRFFAVAALPSADPQWAAEELARAHRDLGFIGGSLPLNAFATLEGARTLAPLFATAQKLGSHFFIHRGPASSKVPGQPPLIIPQDTEYARWSLINNTHLTAGAITLGLTDFLDPYPDVSVEVIMLGGFLPYIVDTFVAAGRNAGVADPLARLRRIYLDTGPYSRNGEWVAYAAAKIGADRILFGTDYGVGGGKRGDASVGIATLNKALTAEQRQQIFIDNSRALLTSKGLL